MKDVDGFKKEVTEHYMDIDGLVTTDKDPTTRWTGGNQLLATGIYYLLLVQNAAITIQDKANFSLAIKKCYVGPDVPVLNRNPGRHDDEAVDDYYGVCAAARYLGSPISKEIKDYGSENSYFFNNINPTNHDLHHWFGRFPGFPGFLSLCAGEEASWFQRLLLQMVIRSGCSGDSGDDIKKWLQVQVATLNAKTYINQIEVWSESFRNTYSSLGMLFMSYGGSHPFVKYNLN